MRALTRTIACLTALLALGFATPAQDAPVRKHDPFPGWNQRIDETRLDFTHYWPLTECDETAVLLAKRFPELVSVREIGRSFGNRPLYCITFNNAKTGPDGVKPAMYIDSNIHGNETQGTEIIFLTIWYLLKNYGHEEWVTRLVDTRAFYFVPVVNPDSRHLWFSTPNNPHSLRGNLRPFDDDRDGQFDEDSPEDLNGDGRITQMRQRDPNGDWVLDRDKRIMTRRKPGQPGEYRVWGSEGTDNDGDGRINEDGLGGVDLNRNFPSEWRPRYRQFGAGDYPCSEPEVRACVDFILSRPNIAGMQFYHNAARMILRPPGSSPDSGVAPREDVQVYDRLGKRGERIIPGYRYLQTHDGLYQAFGTQIDFGYLGLGRFVFTNELWGSTGHEVDGNPGTSGEDQRDWHEEFGSGRSYIDWKPYSHPQLGEIEIGGWDQFATRMPPAQLFIEEGWRNALFTLRHAESFAELAIDSVVVQNQGGGLYRVRLCVRNHGAFPTDSVKAVERKYDDPVLVSVQGAELVSSALCDEMYANAAVQRGRPGPLRIARIRSEGAQYAELIVRAKPGTELKVTAAHPRSVNATHAAKMP
ncbi:MAG: peptidase M14 [Planctomycetes bacterium]|nr:peptidase M14 [Planctomycetota bacterium]